MKHWTRRDILKAGAAAAAAWLTACVSRSESESTSTDGPRIAVIGGGLAGLTAAYRIRKRMGWAVSVYEASDRFGGRVSTVEGLPGDLFCEAGGTFISTGDGAIRSLASELDVSLIDLEPIWPTGKTQFQFDGFNRTPAQVFEGRGATAAAAERQARYLPWPIRFGEKDPQAIELDRSSVAEWIERFVPDYASIYRDYLKTYFESDYTGPVEEASALMMVADFAAPGRSYDERYVIDGGSSQLVSAMTRALPAESLNLNSPLLAIAQKTSGGYRLTVEREGTANDVDADAVVLALPFPALRNVDLTNANFSPLKTREFQDLGMGTGTKTNLVFDSALWEPADSGESVSDLVTGWTWPGHVGQSESSSKLLVCLTGSTQLPKIVGGPVHGTAPATIGETYLRDLDRIFPGAEDSYSGYARIDRWSDDPWIGGTYSYYRTGTFTEIAGAEGLREGRAFFAGEHTARYGNRATMNGAVWSGEKAAADLVTAFT